MQEIEFFDDEITPLKEYVQTQQFKTFIKHPKISTSPTPDFIVTWGFFLLLSVIATGVGIGEGLPLKIVTVFVFFIAYSFYILFNYKSEYIFDLHYKTIYYRTKIAYLPERVVEVCSFDELGGLLANVEKPGSSWFCLLMLIGSKESVDPQKLILSVNKLRQQGKIKIYKLQEDHQENLHNQGQALAELLKISFYPAPDEFHYLGSSYQLNRVERKAGCISMLMLLSVFVVIAIVIMLFG